MSQHRGPRNPCESISRSSGSIAERSQRRPASPRCETKWKVDLRLHLSAIECNLPAWIYRAGPPIKFAKRLACISRAIRPGYARKRGPEEHPRGRSRSRSRSFRRLFIRGDLWPNGYAVSRAFRGRKLFNEPCKSKERRAA